MHTVRDFFGQEYMPSCQKRDGGIQEGRDAKCLVNKYDGVSELCPHLAVSLMNPHCPTETLSQASPPSLKGHASSVGNSYSQQFMEAVEEYGGSKWYEPGRPSSLGANSDENQDTSLALDKQYFRTVNRKTRTTLPIQVSSEVYCSPVGLQTASSVSDNTCPVERWNDITFPCRPVVQSEHSWGNGKTGGKLYPSELIFTGECVQESPLEGICLDARE